MCSTEPFSSCLRWYMANNMLAVIEANTVRSLPVESILCRFYALSQVDLYLETSRIATALTSLQQFGDCLTTSHGLGDPSQVPIMPQTGIGPVPHTAAVHSFECTKQPLAESGQAVTEHRVFAGQGVHQTLHTPP